MAAQVRGLVSPIGHWRPKVTSDEIAETGRLPWNARAALC